MYKATTEEVRRNVYAAKVYDVAGTLQSYREHNTRSKAVTYAKRMAERLTELKNADNSTNTRNGD